MKKVSSRLLTLLLVLLSIGAFDLHALLSHVQSGNEGIKTGAWPAVSAAPLYRTSAPSSIQARSTKARVGIVLNGGSRSSSKSIGSPLNTITTGGNKSSASAFESPDGRRGMKLPLKRLERSQDSNPLMVSGRYRE